MLFIDQEPATHRQLILATGDETDAHHRFGKRYRQVLVDEGSELILKPSSGAVDKLQSLQPEDEPVDVAFVQGGVAGEMPPEDLETLASVFLEPLWVFVEGDARPFG